MGLAGAKNKRKWAKDPNNTHWSRNTDTFGHKILRSQGWQPGEYLGARDASQSEFFTAANASHVRAVLKDDNLGLGARRNQGDECTGLDAFHELLGRLNGRSEDALGAERKRREDAKLNKYLHRKLGTVRFVFGGYLVGDKVQQLADDLKREKDGAEASRSADVSNSQDGKKEKKSKKRKAGEEDGVRSDRKKEKKSKRRKIEDAEAESKSKRKEKKDKKRREKVGSKVEPQSRNDKETPTEDADEDTPTRRKSQKDKKDKRKKSKHDEDANSADASDLKHKKGKKRKSEEEASTEPSEPAAPPTEPSTPTASGTSTPVSDVPHRHLARKRFIAQKRAAVMDPAALNQIFMIKA